MSALVIRSQSQAVTRTLQAIAARVGDGSALALIDTAHPPQDDAALANDTLRITLGISPIHPQQLVEQIRLARARTPTQLGHGWRLERESRSLCRDDQPPLALTEKEVALLLCLLQSPDGVPRERLLEQVWGIRAAMQTHTLETHIYRLRQKAQRVAPPPFDILVDHGCYRLAVAPAAPGGD